MKIIEPSQLISTDSCAPPTCESCGEQFNCGATLGGCWCSEVKVTERVRAQLRERYSSCLCRACLERFAAESLSEP